MTTVHVSASTEYDVTIGSGLLDHTGDRLRTLHTPCKTAVITDSTVKELYLSRVVNSLEAAGYSVVSYSFEQGEHSKNLAVLSDILEFLALQKLSRTDLVLALGGGVTGDMAGFAASVYQRGIHFVQLPTTLLAAVDSSVGGKTAVNLKAGKNLAGAFYQPDLVLCDTDTLSTLPTKILEEGTAEVIKYAMLSDRELFDMLFDGIENNLEEIIARCVRQKAGLVHQDEFDTGHRQFLNFGHTIGHAVELCSNFTVSHGAAVAAGMAIMTRACVNDGSCSAGCQKELEKLLKLYHLPTGCSFSSKQLHAAALLDKKHALGQLTIVIPREIGHCELRKIDDTELNRLIISGSEI